MFIISRIAAPVGDVIIPIRVGIFGRGFFRFVCVFSVAVFFRGDCGDNNLLVRLFVFRQKKIYFYGDCRQRSHRVFRFGHTIKSVGNGGICRFNKKK